MLNRIRANEQVLLWLESYAEAVALVMTMELAQLEILQEEFEVDLGWMASVSSRA